MAEEESVPVFVYVIVNNIPETYHSKDLRNFFSQFIESGRFSCFHFRHRPEVQRPKNGTADGDNSVKRKTTCCVVRLERNEEKETFITLYNNKHWMDKSGQNLATKCFVSRIKSMEAAREKVYLTRAEQSVIPEDREVFTHCHLEQLPELHPPAVMPRGNVGTPTAIFLDMIRCCRLPSSVIGKLGLEFPKHRRGRKYGSVPYDYGGEISIGHAQDEERVLTASGHELTDTYIDATLRPSYSTSKEKTYDSVSSQKGSEVEEEEQEEEEDDDECEEWDRHEAFHNDVTQQDRTKERLYEEEIELKWEKGGSGLVFYTDAQYWDEKEGDFDAKTSDDWDLDMSVYYEKNGGDMDSRDYVQLRREQRLRKGLEVDSAFKKPIGAFEKHTKGIGRRILEKQGWKDGDGLGSTITGIADALENDGQNPKNKRGFGYHGEKIKRYSSKRPHRHLIATVFDKRESVEDKEPLLRSNLPTAMKYRLNAFVGENSKEST